MLIWALMLFLSAQWYFVCVAFCLVPFMAISNSYGAGLTDQDNSSMYGKLCIFIFAAWAGTSGQGAIAGLGICGVVLSATSQAASLMQVCLSLTRLGLLLAGGLHRTSVPGTVLSPPDSGWVVVDASFLHASSRTTQLQVVSGTRV